MLQPGPFAPPNLLDSLNEHRRPHWLVAFFIVSDLIALFVDFAMLHKQGTHAVTVKEAMHWSLARVGLSLAFDAFLWWAVRDATGDDAQANARGMEFLTGYLIEKSLAVDNIFVFLMLSGVKMWHFSGKELALEDNPVLKLLLRVMPVSDRFDGERFLTVQWGRRIATPLLMVVAMVGFTDVIFAVDSIPAIFTITTDPFIVLSSNIFAVLGLGAMFLLLAAVAARFHLLSYGLAVILLFIGGKMLLTDIVKIPVLVSLGVVVSVLVITMVWSVRTAPKLRESIPKCLDPVERKYGDS